MTPVRALPFLRSLASLAILGAAASACSGGNGGGGGDDYGESSIPLAEDCEGVAGMNGNEILAANTVTHLESELSYTTAEGPATEHTPVEIDITWPSPAEAICYPAFLEDDFVIAQPRVAIEGLTLAVVTSDGKFAETLDARGWILSNGGFPNPPVVVAVTHYDSLEGSWEPYPDYTPVGETMTFVATPVASNPDFSHGMVTRGGGNRSELEAGIFRSSFQMASW